MSTPPFRRVVRLVGRVVFTIFDVKQPNLDWEWDGSGLEYRCVVEYVAATQS